MEKIVFFVLVFFAIYGGIIIGIKVSDYLIIWIKNKC